MPALNRELVDIASHDEVVFGQAADRTGPQDDLEVAVSVEVKVRVMPLSFSQGGDRVEEVDARHEVLHRPRSADSFRIRVQSPAFEVYHEFLGLGTRERGAPPSRGTHRFLVSSSWVGVFIRDGLLFCWKHQTNRAPGYRELSASLGKCPSATSAM